MKTVLRVGALLWLGFAFVGCKSIAADSTDDIVVETSARVSAENPSEDKRGAFFLKRSMLCRKAFGEAMAKIAAQTGRTEDDLRGATIRAIEEEFTNGVYSINLDVAWSETRENAAARIVAASNSADVALYVPSVDEGAELAAWIGPKQAVDDDGAVHFLGFSAMAIGRDTVLSQQNIRRAELDAQALAVRAFMGKDRKMTDVRAVFRPIFRQRSRHPLCPDRDMLVCGYEIVSLVFPDK